MLTIYKSFPGETSRNVGDRLIGEAAAEIIKDTTDEEIRLFFDIDDLIANLECVNSSKALFIPAFGIRSKIWRPKLLKAIRNNEITVPVVPLASGWSDFPGDYEQITSKNYPHYSDEVINTYRQIAKDAPSVSAREYYTQKVLEKIGIESQMVGDCAWYDPEYIGADMHKPDTIDKLVVTDPHSPQYFNQTYGLMDRLHEMFPNANKYLCIHSSVKLTQKQLLVDNAEGRGFNIKDVSGDTSNIGFYADCDLHIGHRVHGHIGFLRKRRPSVLLCEDGRGLGFTETLGGCGFPAFTRRVAENKSTIEKYLQTLPEGVLRKVFRKYPGPPKTKHPYSPARDDVVDQALDFVTQELEAGWTRYQMIPQVIDSTYKKSMKPFIRNVLETNN